VALRNLEIVLDNRHVLDQIPGASLINLADHEGLTKEERGT
jgi:hypothetical protein